MKRSTLIVVLALISAFGAFGQQSDWSSVYSDKFHFIASFPSEPKEFKDDVEMSFGKASAQIWKLEQPGITYEVWVAEFPELAVDMNTKALASFYSQACLEFGGPQGKCLNNRNNQDFFGEVGTVTGFRTNDGYVSLSMFLAGKRFYLARVYVLKSAANENRSNINKFLDEFSFIYPDKNKEKMIWGLPKAESQNLNSN
jgi:hypothetical protein